MKQIFWYTPIFLYLLISGRISALSFRRLSVASGPAWLTRKTYISGWLSLLWHVRYRPQAMVIEAFREAKRDRMNAARLINGR